MKIELYLRHLYQEHPGVDIPMADWTGRWTKSPTYGKYCPCKGAVAMVPEYGEYIYPLQRIFLRAEEFGGLMYDPATTMIYKLDQEAFSLTKKLQDFLAENPVEKSNPELDALISSSLNVDKPTVVEYVKVLKEIKLW